MQKFSKAICKHRKIVLIIALLLLIPSIIGMLATRVNYDILVYLPDDIETLKGQQILQDDFKKYDNVEKVVRTNRHNRNKLSDRNVTR